MAKKLKPMSTTPPPTRSVPQVLGSVPQVATSLSVVGPPNTSERTLVALVVDSSGSMSVSCRRSPDEPNALTTPIAEVNAGLELFKRECLQQNAHHLLEVSVTDFAGDVRTSPFRGVAEWTPPVLQPRDGTHLGAALLRTADLIEARLDALNEEGVPVKSAFLVLLSDGDDRSPDPRVTDRAAARLHQMEAQDKAFELFLIGVQTDDLSRLERFSNKRRPQLLSGVRFRELFRWLSQSLGRVSMSRPGQSVPLPSIDGWAELNQ